ncbi:MAG: hypothetical protein JNM52_06435 [Betaproteobacteria bacterium]|nr:hypothetical protein [Betaproteobacteria bacterium]
MSGSDSGSRGRSRSSHTFADLPGGDGRRSRSGSAFGGSDGGFSIHSFGSDGGHSSDSDRDLPRSPRHVMASYKTDKGSRKLEGMRQLGHGVEAAVHSDGRTAIKSFGGRDFAKKSRDSEFSALQRLDKESPGLVVKPFSKGVVKMGDGAESHAFEMEHVPGGRLPQRLRTPELRRLAPFMREFGQALKATGSTWDPTPANVMRTDHGYKFIDVKSKPGKAMDPDAFTRSRLGILAADPKSVDKVKMPHLMGSPVKPVGVTKLPALPPSFKPKQMKQTSPLETILEKPRVRAGSLAPLKK